MWLDGWTALDRVGTLPTRLHASASKHLMIDRIEGKWSISQGSPLLDCGALDDLGWLWSNDDHGSITLFYTSILMSSQGLVHD